MVLLTSTNIGVALVIKIASAVAGKVKLGQKTIKIELDDKLSFLSENLNKYDLQIDVSKKFLIFKYNIKEDKIKLTEMLNDIESHGIKIKDFTTEESSLEEIFIKLIREDNN